MRILIATDAWHPQLNGVVRTYTRLAEEAKALGAEIIFVTPDDFRFLACPGYPEIHLALPSRRKTEQLIEKIAPDYIHVATEGPVGWMARSYCRRNNRAFTSSYHTKFPEYAAKWMGVPEAWSYAAVRRFHAPSSGVMTATSSLATELKARGFGRLMPWTRGVDAELFRPRDIRLFGSDSPVFLYAGRVSKEKNIEAFLDAGLPGRKVVVGDGPHLDTLRRRYSGVTFTGRKSDAELALHYASADVFVFPSVTDTFGLVLLEAMASGLPVAAYPVTGPIDIVVHGVSGVLDADIAKASNEALALRKCDARARALEFTWARTAKLFLDNIRLAHLPNVYQQHEGRPAVRPVSAVTKRNIGVAPIAGRTNSSSEGMKYEWN